MLAVLLHATILNFFYKFGFSSKSHFGEITVCKFAGSSFSKENHNFRELQVARSRQLWRFGRWASVLRSAGDRASLPPSLSETVFLSFFNFFLQIRILLKITVCIISSIRVIGQRWSGLSSKLSHSVTTHPIFIFIAFLCFSEKALNILPWRHMSMTPPSMCFPTLKIFHIFARDHLWPKNHIFTYFALFSPIIPCTRHKKTF